MILTRLRPTFDRVLIERLPTETRVGGIIIPEQSQNKPNQGFIRDTGPMVLTKRRADDIYGAESEKYNTFQTFEIGDKVQIGQFAGIEMIIDDKEFTLIKQDEIISIIVETDDTVVA